MPAASRLVTSRVVDVGRRRTDRAILRGRSCGSRRRDADRTLVTNIARQLVQDIGFRVEIGDLIGEGFRGLLEARERFDPAKGIPFAGLV